MRFFVPNWQTGQTNFAIGCRFGSDVFEDCDGADAVGVEDDDLVLIEKNVRLAMFT